MPSYRYPDYANFKTSINPRNRGYWDLRLTGQYYSGIKTRVTKTNVKFTQKYKNKKIDWLNSRLEKANKNPLGITNEQMIDIQKKSIPKLRNQLMEIIKNTNV